MHWTRKLNEVVSEKSLDKRLELSFEFVKLFSIQSDIHNSDRERELLNQIAKLRHDLEESERSNLDLLRKIGEDARRRAVQQTPKKKRRK